MRHHVRWHFRRPRRGFAARSNTQPRHIRNMLARFSEGYDRFTEKLVGRKHLLALRKKVEAGARLSEAESMLTGALTNAYDLTVWQTLGLICDAAEDPALIGILGLERVQEAIRAHNNEEIVALLHRALAKHRGT